LILICKKLFSKTLKTIAKWSFFSSRILCSRKVYLISPLLIKKGMVAANGEIWKR
jgi:hypothetical protein